MYIHQKSKQELSFKKVNNLFLNAVSSLRTVSLTGNDTFPHHRACLTRVPLIPYLPDTTVKRRLWETLERYMHMGTPSEILFHMNACVCVLLYTTM